MDPRVHRFGIRHHGPGSAWSLSRALDRLDPAVVLVEGPPDADALIPFVVRPAMKPPVAILVHPSDDPTESSFYPYAEFSPEWVALRWAVTRKRPARFIDLPVGARRPKEPVDPGTGPEDDSTPRAAGPESEPRDPLGQVAAVAGYGDGEAWWEALIEQQDNPADVFPAIAEAMTALREAVGPPRDAGERDTEARREAHMRQAIRTALRETGGAIAVVTGAWHVPALSDRFSVAADRAILRGLTSRPTTATWVPWTDPRLATSSGYAAGVISPGWYRHVFAELSRSDPDPDRTGQAIRWLARVAALLRSKGLAASPASVIEATRLGISLASIRELAVAGLAELSEASLAVLCGGDELPGRLIERELIIGTTVGEVDPEVPQMPLQADLARWQRKLRLPPRAELEDIACDLRTETGLGKSILLHRLQLIDVPWGQLLDAGRSRGTFRERWAIQWQPELSVSLAEALHWGSTIAQASGAAALDRAGRETAVDAVAQVVQQALLADLPDAAERGMVRLQALASAAGDVSPLMKAVPPLAEVLRYGTARRLPEVALRRLVSAMMIEIAVGLPTSCHHLDAEQAGEMAERIASLDHAVSLLEDESLAEEWRRALEKLADAEAAAPLTRGAATRRLHDRGVLSPETLERHVSRSLSLALPPAVAGGWIEGFLAGAGQVLLHDEMLFGALDGWLQRLDEPSFLPILPMLRRAFGEVDPAERRRLLAVVRRGRLAGASAAAPAGAALAAFERARPLLELILGLDRPAQEASDE